MTREWESSIQLKGPVFANIVLLDEINRSNAKTQSAMLEVMEEAGYYRKPDAQGPERCFHRYSDSEPD